MSKQSHDCYTDNLKVKISERYKPPPRINLAISYAQRLTLNKQIQDNMPNYEFSLERTALSKMKEWRSCRFSIVQERKEKIEKAREHLEKKKRERESLEKEQLEEIELKTVNETATNSGTSTSTSYIGVTNISNLSQNYGTYTVNNDILVPTQITNPYSNILTPIPLQNYGTQQYSNKNDKSPFNISDFENDTSSPFDNMELKSINDMEELAQVLNRDKNNYKLSSNTPVYSNFPSVKPSTHIQPTYLGSNYVYNIPTPASYVQPIANDYSRTNGYYYENNPFRNQYLYKPSPREYYAATSQSPSSTVTTTLESKKPNCKSVPDIMKALENEIESTHISTSVPQESYIKNDSITQTTRPKSTDAVYPRAKIKTEELDDPFYMLTKNQQDLCKSISSMGFPLSRVARICQIVGDDQKKVVDHLLALSDLLDLGFAEKDISNALVQCDNDKDKALDKLIS